MNKKRKAALSAMAFALLTTMMGNSLLPPVFGACCYFAAKDKDINQPGQKAFISWNPKDKFEAFTVQPKFEGNAVDFGMVIPTPSKPKLDTMPRDFFKDLAMYTILMPLPEAIYTPGDPPQPMAAAMPMAAFGGKSIDFSRKKESVHVLESGVVGSLDYKIILADDANGLFEWLKANHYSYGGDEATLQFYIKKKWLFTVMKIDPAQMKKGPDGSYLGEVTPTRFAFSTAECIYPLKITQLSVKKNTDALFYVQAPSQMDLQADWSWMHSYRSMYLTYMLGCSADPQQQAELQKCDAWLAEKRQKDPNYETTKLEWAKALNDRDLSVLEDPKKNYGLMGTGDLPKGAKVLALNDFLAEVKAEYLKRDQKIDQYAKQDMTQMEDRYQPAKGFIVKYDPKSVGTSFVYSRYAWYPARDVPSEDVKGLTRLKGHLQKGQWLTKFRKILRKDEMTHDLVLAEVPKTNEQTYTRIMPTSPP